MATSTIKAPQTLESLGGISLESINDTEFTETSVAGLLACLNRNTLKNGSYVLRINGGTSLICKAVILIDKVSNSFAGGIVSSYLNALNGIKIRINNNGDWIQET